MSEYVRAAYDTVWARLTEDRKSVQDDEREDTAARATRMEQMIKAGYTGPDHDYD